MRLGTIAPLMGMGRELHQHRARNAFGWLVAFLILVAGSCDLTVTDTTEGNTPSGEMPHSVHADGLLTGATVGGGGPVDTGAATVVDVANLVIRDLEHFWSNHWNSSYPNVPFQEPTDYQLYRGGEIPDFACADPADDPDTYESNAFYCPSDQSIVFDTGWFEDLWTQHGDFGPAALLAHEWGHHVQHLLRSVQDPLFSIQAELQADCFAGVWARNAGRSGAFPVNAADIDEAAATFYSIGYEARIGWFAPVEHGTATERVNAFQLGYGSGKATACSDLANYRMNQTVTLEPYVIGLLEAETATTQSNHLAISGAGYGDVQVQITDISLPANTGATQTLLDSMRIWATDDAAPHGSSLYPYHAVEDLSAYTEYARVPGSAAGFSYSQILGDEQVHGYYFHHNTGAGSGLVVDVFRPGEPPLDKADWADLVAVVWRIIFSFQTS